MWVIFDGNYLLHRSMHLPAYCGLRATSGMYTGGVYGVLLAIGSTLREVRGTRAICVWDGKYSKRRLALFPEYKQERRHQQEEGFDYPEEFRQSRVQLHRLLPLLGVRSLRDKESEADDVMYRAAQHAGQNGAGPSVIVTEDKDLWQVVSRTTAVYRPRSRAWVRLAEFERATGFQSPREFLWWKVLRGDPGDNINGVPGLGDVRAKRLVEVLRVYADRGVDLRSALESCNRVATDVWVQRALRYWGIIKRNVALIDLSAEECTETTRLLIQECLRCPARFQGSSARPFFEALELRSLSLEYGPWMRSFARLR